MFNYREATLEETIEKVLTSKKQAVQAAKRYYMALEEKDVVEKIDTARRMAIIERLQNELRSKQNVYGVEDKSASLDGGTDGTPEG